MGGSLVRPVIFLCQLSDARKGRKSSEKNLMLLFVASLGESKIHGLTKVMMFPPKAWTVSPGSFIHILMLL